MVKNFVKNVYLALIRFLAHVEMMKHRKAVIIGITGSSGKTSCKDMLVAFLKPHYKNKLKFALKGNSESGVPYEILDIPVRYYAVWEYPYVILQAIFHIIFIHDHYEIFIIEYGIDGPDEPLNMEYLLKVIKPQIALLLSVSGVHGERFEKKIDPALTGDDKVFAIERAIAQEKFKLLSTLPNKKLAFVTKQVLPYLSPEQYKGMTILDEEHFTFPVIENSKEGSNITITTEKGALSTLLPEVALPAGTRVNILFATLLTKYFKKDIRTSVGNLPENFHLAPGRSSVLPGLNGTIILDSSYNANPLGSKQLFPLVKELARKGRRKKVIVLGDFRELGSATENIYHDVMKDVSKYADILILTNPLMKKYGIPAATDAGFVMNENLYWFENGKQLSFHIMEVIEKNAVVLFEGSQNTVYLEYAVKELVANKTPSYILSHIPRMSSDWLTIK